MASAWWGTQRFRGLLVARIRRWERELHMLREWWTVRWLTQEQMTRSLRGTLESRWGIGPEQEFGV